jgi:GT2 family glycosyltransferase
MLDLLLRGWRLLRANPRLFWRRLQALARSPRLTVRDLRDSQARSRRIRAAYAAWLATFPEPDSASAVDGPLLSVIMPVFNPAEDALRAAIASVCAQTYRHWELCIVDDASSAAHVRPILEEAAGTDPRLRLAWRERQGHIAVASNDALALASGDFIVLLDHDDFLAPGALASIAQVIRSHPEVDLIYSDEDKLDGDGRRVEPFFKPAWSPTLLETCNYITHLGAVRRSLALSLGGFRPELVGSQDHDLFLRVAEQAREIAHIPDVLYTWRKSATSTAATTSAKPYAVEAARRALSDAIDRRGLEARLEPAHLNGLFFVRRSVPLPLRITALVFGQGHAWKSLIDVPAVDLRGVIQLAELGAARPLVSSLSLAEDSEYLLLVDSRLTAMTSDAVVRLAEYAQEPEIAAAGGMTVDARRGIVLQAGLTIDDGGEPRYTFAGLPLIPQRNFYLNLKDLPREVRAVWAGWCLVRRDVWSRLGGCTPALPFALAVVDFCLRAGDLGLRTVYVAPAQTAHEGDLPRMPPTTNYDWTWRDAVDPYWSPHLSPQTADGLPLRHGSRSPRVLKAK